VTTQQGEVLNMVAARTIDPVKARFGKIFGFFFHDVH